jgi:uncharacterized membrane protein
VTTDLAAARPGGGRSRLLWIVLALSLVLNICAVGSFVWAKMQAREVQLTPAERVEAVAKQLALDANQRPAFDRFIRTIRMRTRHLREANAPLGEDIWGELAKAQPDEALLDRSLQSLAENRRTYQIDVGHALREFLVVLTPEQRQTMIELIRTKQNRDVPPLMRQLVQ